MANPVITGVGMFVPDRVVTNDELRNYYDTSDEWIRERSGIQERRWVENGEGPADLAVPAVQHALNEAGITKDDLDFVIFATLSPEAYFPGSGCYLQKHMDLSTVPCLDIRMQCSGFIYGLSIAEMYIRAGKYRNILVVGGEVQSTALDLTPEGRQMGVLFGDGAGAVVVQAQENTERGIQGTWLHSQGHYAEKLWLSDPTSRSRPRYSDNPKMVHPDMEGREVFKHAVVRMSEAVMEALAGTGWSKDEVALYVPHQANLRISQAVAKQFELPEEKFMNNIQKYGNTTAATIPIALYEAQQAGRLKKGDKVVLMAFGSGFTWGSAALVW